MGMQRPLHAHRDKVVLVRMAAGMWEPVGRAGNADGLVDVQRVRGSRPEVGAIPVHRPVRAHLWRARAGSEPACRHEIAGAAVLC